MQQAITAEEEELLRLMSSSRSQSRARFEGETRYSSAGGAAVQERLGRGRSDLPYSAVVPFS